MLTVLCTTGHACSRRVCGNRTTMCTRRGRYGRSSRRKPARPATWRPAGRVSRSASSAPLSCRRAAAHDPGRRCADAALAGEPTSGQLLQLARCSRVTIRCRGRIALAARAGDRYSPSGSPTTLTSSSPENRRAETRLQVVQGHRLDQRVAALEEVAAEVVRQHADQHLGDLVVAGQAQGERAGEVGPGVGEVGGVEVAARHPRQLVAHDARATAPTCWLLVATPPSHKGAASSSCR